MREGGRIDYLDTNTWSQIQISLDHNPHGKDGLSLDLNPEFPCVNTTDLDLDQNLHVNGELGS